MTSANAKDKVVLPVIGVVSVIVPLVVAVLIFLTNRPASAGFDLSFLPMLNAVINSTVTILLIAGFVFIRQKKIQQHRVMMLSALALSVIFLVSYILYHTFSGHVTFEGPDAVRYTYYFILLTHILLSVVVVPLALLSVYRGWTNNVLKHRKVAKWTLPIWVYVSVTGVVVYLMAHVIHF